MTAPMDQVAILLSTKNGARFINDQLRSVFAQTYRNKRLFWRDDGSTDDTVRTVRESFDCTPSDIAPLGVTRSYAKLLNLAWDAGCDFFALADQDDVWAHDKLARGVTILQRIPGPALYCARQTLVDVDLRIIGSSPLFHEPIGFPAALTQNIAPGCTIILNREAADLVRQTMTDQPYHDWWCYLIVAAAGGSVVADPAEVMWYRQHDHNAIGAPSNRWKRALNAMRRGPSGFMTVFRTNVGYLHANAAFLSPTARQDLEAITTALNGGMLHRLRALRHPGFRRQTRSENSVFWLWFMFG